MQDIVNVKLNSNSVDEILRATELLSMDGYNPRPGMGEALTLFGGTNEPFPKDWGECERVRHSYRAERDNPPSMMTANSPMLKVVTSDGEQWSTFAFKTTSHRDSALAVLSFHFRENFTRSNQP